MGRKGMSEERKVNKSEDIKKELIDYINEDLQHFTVKELGKVYKLVRKITTGV
jgi:hypothetical protein